MGENVANQVQADNTGSYIATVLCQLHRVIMPVKALASIV